LHSITNAPPRRVRSKTAIAEQPGSIPAAAAQLARQFFGELEGRRILIIGAGKMSELAARSLVSGGVEKPVMANRTLARAEELASRTCKTPSPTASRE
jgi:glutamyl-tRNA reductase